MLLESSGRRLPSHLTDSFVFSVSGSHRNVSAGSQTGDTLGKALASVSTEQLLHLLVPFDSQAGA